MLEHVLANWPLKLLSLILAFGIWVSVTGENRIVHNFTLPLDIQLAEGRALTTDPPTTVTVRLRGPERAIRRLDGMGLAVRVDLRDGLFGERSVPLTARNLTGVPRGVELDFINPDRLKLVVDRLMQRELPVEPTFLGKPPEGYAFYGAEVDPETLLVEGPQSEVEQLEVLRTNPIRLDQFTEPSRVPVATVPAGRFVHVVDARPVEVRVLVDSMPVERRFSGIRVELVGQAYEAVAAPSTVNATLTGPPALIELLREDRLRAVADVSELEPRPEPYQVTVRLEYLDIPVEDRSRITLTSLSQPQVGVRVLDKRLGP